MSCEASERRSFHLVKPSSHDPTRVVGYQCSGKRPTWSLYLKRDPNTKLPNTTQYLWPVFARRCLGPSTDIQRRGVSSSLKNTASGRACHVTPNSLTLTMTSTQCFQPTNRSIALWSTSARLLIRCHMGSSSQNSTDTELKAKPERQLSMSGHRRLLIWQHPSHLWGTSRLCSQPHPVFAVYGDGQTQKCWEPRMDLNRLENWSHSDQMEMAENIKHLGWESPLPKTCIGRPSVVMWEMSPVQHSCCYRGTCG